jgi:hypothetical protein
MPRERKPWVPTPHYTRHIATERRRFDLFIELTLDGMSAAEAITVIDEQVPLKGEHQR